MGSELKAEGMSGGQINKNSDIVDWVAKLNALKEKEAALKGNMTEKEAKKEATGKKDANFMDAERILVGKEPITPSNKTPQNSKPKGGEYDDLFASADAGKNYVAAVSTELVFTSKKKKDKAAKGLSEKELEDMEKLKQNIMTKKSELKAEGMSGGQINKNSDIVDWVAKLNALK